MKYKAVALDLDGTLKSSDKTILPKTKKIIIDLAKQGVIINLASGRPTYGMFKEAEELQLDVLGGYILSFNGARIIEQKSNKIMYDKTFSGAVAHQVYNRAKEFGLSVLTYIDDIIISEDVNDEYVQFEASLNDMPMKSVDSFVNHVSQNVNKVLLTGKPEYIEKVIIPFSKTFTNSLSVYRSMPFFIEVMDQGVDKASSLQYIIESLGIHAEQLVAFGDGYNDLSMVSYAGLGVAMGNGVEEVKKVADYITDTNDDEGIYNCLKKLQEKGEI